MPELPEVEVTRRGLLPHLPGHLVQEVWCGQLALRRPIPCEALRREVAGYRIADIRRRGKYLLVMLSSGSVMLLHLGMSGRLRLEAADEPRRRHDHLELTLDSDMLLRFNDARRFGLVEVWPADDVSAKTVAFERAFGPEPLDPAFNGTCLQRLAKTSIRPVKELLLQSRIVAGIGNIYASESLFRAGIHPATPGRDLDARQWQRVAAALVGVLRDAIAAGGTTISDFLNVAGASGYFQLELAVYGRAGLPCRQCGRSVVKILQGGRSTFFCPECQRKKRSRRAASPSQ